MHFTKKQAMLQLL